MCRSSLLCPCYGSACMHMCMYSCICIMWLYNNHNHNDINLTVHISRPKAQRLFNVTGRWQRVVPELCRRELRLIWHPETWPLRAVDLRKLEVFGNDCLRYILRYRRIDRMPTTTLHLNLHPLPPVLLQRRLRWFGHVARRPEVELIRDVLLPTSPPNRRKRVGGQLKTWASKIKDDLAALSGPQVVGLRRWNRDCLAISCDLAQDQRTWAAMVRDAVRAREEAGSTRLG